MKKHKFRPLFYKNKGNKVIKSLIIVVIMILILVNLFIFKDFIFYKGKETSSLNELSYDKSRKVIERKINIFACYKKLLDLSINYVDIDEIEATSAYINMLIASESEKGCIDFISKLEEERDFYIEQITPIIKEKDSYKMTIVLKYK